MKNTPAYLSASVRALLIDDRTEYLITNRPVVWYNLIQGVQGGVVLIREDLGRFMSSRERKALKSFAVFSHEIFEPSKNTDIQLTVHSPGANRDDICSWSGFLKIVRKTRASSNSNGEVFFFDNRPSVIHSKMWVFQKSQYPKFDNHSHLRIGRLNEDDPSGHLALAMVGCGPRDLNT